MTEFVLAICAWNTCGCDADASEIQGFFHFLSAYTLVMPQFLVSLQSPSRSADVLTTHGELSQPPEDLVVLETSFAGAFCVPHLPDPIGEAADELASGL